MDDMLIEFIGALMTFLSVISAVKEQRVTWIWAILSAVFYAYIYWSAGLWVSAEVQAVYFGISLYGLVRWRKDAETQRPKEQIKSGTYLTHLVTLLAVGILTTALVYLNHHFKGAKQLVFDSLLVACAIVAQGLMAKKYLACWYLWIMANIGYIVLFVLQELWISLILYVILFYFTLQGFRKWHYKFKMTKDNALHIRS